MAAWLSKISTPSNVLSLNRIRVVVAVVIHSFAIKLDIGGEEKKVVFSSFCLYSIGATKHKHISRDR